MTLIDEFKLREEIQEEVKRLVKEELGGAENLKITKNSKGFSWEFKLRGDVEEQINRVEEINKKLKEKLE